MTVSKQEVNITTQEEARKFLAEADFRKLYNKVGRGLKDGENVEGAINDYKQFLLLVWCSENEVTVWQKIVAVALNKKVLLPTKQGQLAWAVHKATNEEYNLFCNTFFGSELVFIPRTRRNRIHAVTAMENTNGVQRTLCRVESFSNSYQQI